MSFMRKTDSIAAPDRYVWLFKANALDQLAAFLQTTLENKEVDSGLPRHTQAEQGDTGSGTPE